MVDFHVNRTRFRDLADRLRAGYWFLPMVMAVGAVAGALLVVSLDQTYFGQSLVQLTPSSVLDTASFRELAVLVATSTLAFIGVIFSIMLVPLSIAATQLGPPVLRTFMRNTGTQIVLGLFIGNTFFALTLLATVPEGAELPPALSSITLLGLFMTSVAALVYFINEVARSLQASTVIDRLSSELQGDIERELPVRPQREPDFAACEALRADILVNGVTIRAQKEGYIRAIDYSSLIRIAIQASTTVAMRFEPGDFVMRGDALACVPTGTPVDGALVDQVNRQFLMGNYRTITQDIDFGLVALVAVAVRALSPAINDPFTAVMCVQRLGAALAMIAERGENFHHYRDAGGILRLLGEPDTFEEHADLCFHSVRQYGRGSAEVLVAMLRAVARVAERTGHEDQRNILRLHADLIDRDARAGSLTEYDITRVRVQYDHTIAVLDGQSAQGRDDLHPHTKALSESKSGASSAKAS
jgi:uncharacterized membrane protein